MSGFIVRTLANELLLDNATLDAVTGKTDYIPTSNTTFLEVLISVGSPTGTDPSIQFFVSVDDSDSGLTITQYPSLVLTKSGTTYIVIDRLLLGNVACVCWRIIGTDVCWPNVFVRAIGKK